MRDLVVMVSLLAALAPGARGQTPMPAAFAQATYDVPPPSSHGGSPDGWGLYATMRGRTLDLRSRDGWSDDPRVQTRDVEAGYGWRGTHASAVIGYDQHDYGPRFDASYGHGARSPGDPHPVSGAAGVLGLSFTVRAP